MKYEITILVVGFLLQLGSYFLVVVKPLLKVNATMQKLIDTTNFLVERVDKKESVIEDHEKKLVRMDQQIDFHEKRINDLEGKVR